MMMILIAGPYRSGTGDDPALIKKNVEAMNRELLPVYEAGHLPVLGEWFALPVIKEAGSKEIGDTIFNEHFHPIAIKLLEKCDAVLRIAGHSEGADEMVRIARLMGKRIFYHHSDIAEDRDKQTRNIAAITATLENVETINRKKYNHVT